MLKSKSNFYSFLVSHICERGIVRNSIERTLDYISHSHISEFADLYNVYNEVSLKLVTYINILLGNFTYESLFGSFFYLNITREKLLKRCLYEKFVRKMFEKLTPEAVFKLMKFDF